MVEQSEGFDLKEAPAEYLARLAERASPRSNFDKALLAYLALAPRTGRTGLCDGRRARMVEALNGQATWIQIRHWRRGTNRVPQWARDMLARKLAEQRTRADRGIESLQRSA